MSFGFTRLGSTYLSRTFLQDLVDDLQLGQVVVGRGVRLSVGVGGRGARRSEPVPEPVAVKAKGEEGGDTEGSEKRDELERACEKTHRIQYRRARRPSGPNRAPKVELSRV